MANQYKEDCYEIKRAKLILASFMLLAMSQVLVVSSLYIPNAHTSNWNPVPERREDSDEDDMDQTASTPYQNQEDGANGGDGYEDNESDGPYGETPRDEEGQADLERFFDDHLGASERDGMDKENLPSNLIPIVFMNPQEVGDSKIRGWLSHGEPDNHQVANSPETMITLPTEEIKSNRIGYPAYSQAFPNVETSYIKLPDNKNLIITRQITHGPIYKGGIDLDYISNVPLVPQIPNMLQSNEALTANGSEIVATEDDDSDRVYVTKLTKKPFRIDALGGFDPEEDFKDASRDIEEQAPTKYSSSEDEDKRNNNEQDSQSSKDISFSDPETDTLFNDASETDEVTFAQDDPYQTDLEAEMQANSYHQPRESNSNADTDDESSTDGGTTDEKRRRDDDSDGSWVNDGVEDMDIPSQTHQDTVLNKAAKQEALIAKRAGVSDDDETQPQEEETVDDANSQRMPNADYMKDDLKLDDSDYKAR